MPKLPDTSLQLGLVALDELSFSCDMRAFQDAKGTIDTDVQADMAYRQEGELFTVEVTARFFYRDNDAKAAEPESPGIEMAHLTAQMVFHVPQAARVMEPTGQPDELRLLTPVAALLVSTAYATLRGMVFVRFAHTPLRQIPLGLVDSTKIVEALPPFRIAED